MGVGAVFFRSGGCRCGGRPRGAGWTPLCGLNSDLRCERSTVGPHGRAFSSRRPQQPGAGGCLRPIFRCACPRRRHRNMGMSVANLRMGAIGQRPIAHNQAARIFERHRRRGGRTCWRPASVAMAPAQLVAVGEHVRRPASVAMAPRSSMSCASQRAGRRGHGRRALDCSPGYHSRLSSAQVGAKFFVQIFGSSASPPL
jgi:hypothetical protein